MKILAIGDFHGKIPKNLKRFIDKNKIDMILSPGDFVDDNKVKKLKLDGRWWDEKYWKKVGIKKKKRLLKELYNSGVEILKKLNSLNIPVYLVFGNVDFYKGCFEQTERYYEDIIKNLRNLKLIHKKITKINNLTIAGHGGIVQPHIFLNKKDENYKESFKFYKKLEREVCYLFKKNSKIKIFLTHTPPYNLKLDLIRDSTSSLYRKHVGFDVYRKIIEKYQPMLVVCGHLHENQGVDKIGKTLIVNSGYGRNGEAAIIELETKIKFIKFLQR